MKIRFTKKDFLTIPNLLSLLRILLIAPFVCFFISGNYVAAAIMLIISGLSDACDGYIARTFNQVTSVGKLLDPIADKLTLFAIMVCITLFSPVLTPFMIILIIKDLFMLIGGTIMFRKNIAPPAAKWYGKVGTFIFYITVCLIVFLKAAFNYENLLLSVILLSVTTGFMLFALVRYFLIFYKSMKDLH